MLNIETSYYSDNIYVLGLQLAVGVEKHRKRHQYSGVAYGPVWYQGFCYLETTQNTNMYSADDMQDAVKGTLRRLLKDYTQHLDINQVLLIEEALQGDIPVVEKRITLQQH